MDDKKYDKILLGAGGYIVCWLGCVIIFAIWPNLNPVMILLICPFVLGIIIIVLLIDVDKGPSDKQTNEVKKILPANNSLSAPPMTTNANEASLTINSKIKANPSLSDPCIASAIFSRGAAGRIAEVSSKGSPTYRIQ